MNLKGLLVGLFCFVMGLFCGLTCYHIAVTSGVDMEEKIDQLNAAIIGVYEKVLPDDLCKDIEEKTNE